MFGIFLPNVQFITFVGMYKTGKVSVRVFLNQNVNPVRSPLTGDDDFYPLYIQVTYNRRNTQFRSFYRNTYTSLEQAYDNDQENIAYEEQLILKVVAYEILFKKDLFQLKGLKDRYMDYTMEIEYYIDQYLRVTLYEALTRSGSEYWKILDPISDVNIPITLFYEASKKLINNMDSHLPKVFNAELKSGQECIGWCQIKHDNPRLIDWLDKSLITDYKKYLRRMKYIDTEIDHHIDFLNKVVRVQTGFVPL